MEYLKQVLILWISLIIRIFQHEIVRQYKKVSQQGYSSAKHSAGKDIPERNSPSVRIFQHEIAFKLVIGNNGNTYMVGYIPK